MDLPRGPKRPSASKRRAELWARLEQLAALPTPSAEQRREYQGLLDEVQRGRATATGEMFARELLVRLPVLRKEAVNRAMWRLAGDALRRAEAAAADERRKLAEEIGAATAKALLKERRRKAQDAAALSHSKTSAGMKGKNIKRALRALGSALKGLTPRDRITKVREWLTAEGLSVAGTDEALGKGIRRELSKRKR